MKSALCLHRTVIIFGDVSSPLCIRNVKNASIFYKDSFMRRYGEYVSWEIFLRAVWDNSFSKMLVSFITIVIRVSRQYLFESMSWPFMFVIKASVTHCWLQHLTYQILFFLSKYIGMYVISIRIFIDLRFKIISNIFEKCV